MKHPERYALSVSHEIRDQVFPKQKDLVLGRYPIQNAIFSNVDYLILLSSSGIYSCEKIFAKLFTSVLNNRLIYREQNTSKLIRITNPIILYIQFSSYNFPWCRGNVLVHGASGLGFKSQSRQLFLSVFFKPRYARIKCGFHKKININDF
jgi:hypothetical protein